MKIKLEYMIFYIRRIRVRLITIDDFKRELFYKAPKWLMDLFIEKIITPIAFKMYVIMYDRLNLSFSNGWVDVNNNNVQLYINIPYC